MRTPKRKPEGDERKVDEENEEGEGDERKDETLMHGGSKSKTD
jgi:hypothetical protein